MPDERNVKPWYREPWPWILMAGPAAVIVAGAVTIGLAIATDDPLVSPDPYQRGIEMSRGAITPEQRATLPAKKAMATP